MFQPWVSNVDYFPHHLNRVVSFFGKLFGIFSRSTSSFRKISSSATYRVKDSTIFALSSGRGRSGVAIIRLSGPDAVTILEKMTSKRPLPSPRQSVVRTICHPVTEEKLDNGMVVLFRGPRSFTGEDVVEFHVHGGTAVVRAVLNALQDCSGVRAAEPGEFTKRAFINGKMDLTEAEAVADLVHAETEAQRRQALRQMDGALSAKYSEWRGRLLKALANLEAHIDFSEEEHLEPDIIQAVRLMVGSVQKELTDHLNDHRRGERLRNGVNVVIVGEPNVGKSSLLNLICQKPAAIVSPIAGTTRDVVESAFDLAGYPILLSDTAGLRQTTDIIESEGVRRALAHAQSADLIVLVVDVRKLSNTPGRPLVGLCEEHLRSLGIQTTPDQPVLMVFNKCDSVCSEVLSHIDNEGCKSERFLLSCVTGAGFPDFLDALKKKVEDLCGNPLTGEASLTQQRHRYHLQACCKSLEKFWIVLREDDVTMAAHEIQQALRNIGQITGNVRVEEILDVIFKDFCIGK